MAGRQRKGGVVSMRTMEAHLISTLDLPLNLEQNRSCPHFPVLSQLRWDAKRRARQLPVLGGE
jgi:hypothetical protein